MFPIKITNRATKKMTACGCFYMQMPAQIVPVDRPTLDQSGGDRVNKADICWSGAGLHRSHGLLSQGQPEWMRMVVDHNRNALQRHRCVIESNAKTVPTVASATLVNMLMIDVADCFPEDLAVGHDEDAWVPGKVQPIDRPTLNYPTADTLDETNIGRHRRLN